jgi:hypothetical protein
LSDRVTIVTKRKRTGPSATQIIGGTLVDLEQKIFRSLPSAEVLIEHGKDQTGLAADGSGLTIQFPDAPVVVPASRGPHSR